MDKSEKVKVTLDKEHKHKGVNCPIGAEIEVTLRQAEFLAANRVIKKIPSTTTKTADKKTDKQE